MHPKVTIIVPIYNAEKWLSQCIESILNQTFKNFELLLINDGSSDTSGKMCNEYLQKDARIRVYHTENKGASSARNLGIENARGEWIAFVDADDFVKKEYLDVFKYPIQPDIHFFSFGWLHEIEDGTFKKIMTYPTQRMQSYSWIRHKYMPRTPCGYFIKASLVSKYKLRFNTDLTMGEDQEFLIKCFACSDGDVLPLAINTYHYRYNKTGVSKNTKEQILETVISAHRFVVEKNIEVKILKHWFSSRIATFIVFTLLSDNCHVKNDNNLLHALSIIRFNITFKTKFIVFLYLHFPKFLKKISYFYFQKSF